MNKLTHAQRLSLEGSLVSLRKLDPSCSKDFVRAMTKIDPETRRWTSTANHFSQHEIESFVETSLQDNSRLDFLLYDRNSHELVGDLSLNNIDRRNRTASLRIALNGPDYFGTGYGKEALLLALHHGFGMQNLHRMELEVLSSNERAIHVYEKIGFLKEGVKRQASYFDGQYEDLVIMGILASDFFKLYPVK